MPSGAGDDAPPTGSNAPPTGSDAPPAQGSPAGRIRGILGWLAALPVVRAAESILDDFNRAGGGLLAGGLAYTALFAIVPALLLVVGIVGLLVNDPVRRAEAIASIGSSLPPLQTFATDAMPALRDGAGPASLLGVVGLIWGASRFYGSLDDAFSRIFRDEQARGLAARTIRGFVSVLLLIGLIAAFVGASSVAAVISTDVVLGVPVAPNTKEFWTVITPILTIVIFVLGCAVIYRWVPPRTPPFWTLAIPALVVGLALAAFTELFAYIAPRLIGSASQFGQVVAALFGLLVWLGTGFQLLLLGAAWVHKRLPGERSEPAGQA